MKPLADILRQLGLDTVSPPMEATALEEEAAPLDSGSVPIPTGLMDLFTARAQATRALAHVEWPRRGQILRLEKIKPPFDERPFAVLLTEPTATTNVWTGYVVAPESELDFSADGDILLDEIAPTRDPMAGFVQAWNPVRIPIPSVTACLAWLDREAMDRVASTVESPPSSPDLLLPSTIHEYRRIYQQAAEQWTAFAAHLDHPCTTGSGLLERLVEQLANLAQVAPIGQWRPAVEYPMGPEDDQQLIWNLADLVIHTDSHACKIRKIGAEDGPAKVELLLDELLLESHKLTDAGESVVIPLSPEQHAGQLKLAIRQPSGAFIEIVF